MAPADLARRFLLIKVAPIGPFGFKPAASEAAIEHKLRTSGMGQAVADCGNDTLAQGGNRGWVPYAGPTSR